jgi:hypothetical protein
LTSSKAASPKKLTAITSTSDASSLGEPRVLVRVGLRDNGGTIETIADLVGHKTMIVPT